MILLTGATGHIGRALVRGLGAARTSFRALVRSAGKAETIREAGGEAVVGDYREGAALDSALRGVDTLFLLTPTEPDRLEVEGRIVEAACASGASRVVKISVMAAGAVSPPLFARQHRDVERRIEALGLPGTFLRPGYFMQNYLMFADSIRSQGALFASVGRGRHADIDVRDIAAVAARTLTEDGHDGRTYQLTGPEAQSFDDVARKIATITGRDVRFVDVPPEDARKGMVAAGLSEWLADGLLEFYAWFQRGEGTTIGSAATPDVEEILGRPPRSFEAFVRENVQIFGG